MNSKILFRATAAAFGAQGITAAVNALTVLMLANALDAATYGLWQFFVLISSYSGIFHLGICDGAYLNNGGKRQDELDAPKLGTLFRRTTAIQILTALALIPIVFSVFNSSQRAWAVALALVYMPIFNADAYLGHILQTTGNTIAYSASVIINRVSFFVLSLSAMLVGSLDFKAYIVAGILAETVSLIYCLFKTRRIVTAKRADSGVLEMAKRDIAVGSRLMISNLSGQLVTGAARLAVIWKYGEAEFGRISLVMTMANVFLQLISQLGMVLFPSLCRENDAARRRIFGDMRSIVGLILPTVFFAYVPLKLFVKAFLPIYAEGVEYIILLLPMCLLDGKTNLVGTTYFKVNGQAGELMRLNLCSAAVSLIICFGVASVRGDVGEILSAAVISSAIRYILFDVRLHKREGDECGAAKLQRISELALCAAFVLSAALLNDIYAQLVYLVCYFIYLYIRRKELLNIIPAKKA